MTPIAQTRTTIRCTAARAFSLVSNMERFGEWFPSIISIEPANDLPHGKAGKKYLETVIVPLRGERQIEIVVKEAIEDQRFVTEGNFTPLLPRMEISISKVAAKSISLDWTMYSRNTSKLVRALLLPLAKRIIQKRAMIGVEALKAMLEETSEE